MSLSDKFKPSSTFVGLDKPEKKEKEEAQLFQLSDFLGDASVQNRGFAFDSETVRNFDQGNINRAKQGVKELIADAVAKAKARAIEIKDQALKEGENTGYEEGLQKGFQKGENTAKEEYGPLLDTLNNLIRDLSEFRKMMYPKVEKEMVEVIVGLTKKILRHEMNLREDSVKQMILLATNSVIDKENMVIRIHPSDKKHAEAFSPELQSLFGEIKNINFEAHPGIQKGGCVIETNFGTVDAGIDQLEEQIEKILKLSPSVPEVNANSEALPEKIPEPSSDGIEKTAGAKEGSGAHGTISTNEAEEALEDEAPTPKIGPEEIFEPVPDEVESKLKTETKEVIEVPDTTSADKKGEAFEGEAPASEAPSPEIGPKGTPKELEDLSDSKDED